MSILFHIKNMVCDRCKRVVEDSFKEVGAHVMSTELGEIQTAENLEPSQLEELAVLLKQHGFELLDDRQSRIVEKIKNAVIELIRNPQHEHFKSNFSDYLSEKLNRDYSGLSTLFSAHEGTTIEQYIIRQKIERVKELLMYDEQSLSQIADELQYSSVGHLSNQFKKVTGLTPSQFKQSTAKNRLSLDHV